MPPTPETVPTTTTTVARLMTIDEAAEYLNVAPKWVKEAVRLRQIRCTRLGRHVRFRAEHLEEFIAAHEQPVTSLVTAGASNPLRAVPAPRPGGARAHL